MIISDVFLALVCYLVLIRLVKVFVCADVGSCSLPKNRN